MIPTSDTYNQIINNNGRKFHVGAHVAFADGTNLDLNDRNIMASNGLLIEDAVSESGKFQVGSAIINQISLRLNNYEGIFNKYDFKGAVITPYIGLTTMVHWRDGEIVEKLQKGTFTVYKSPAVGSEINVVADDNLAKLDVAYSKSTLKYPATLGQIAADACSVCGVTLATTTFPNSTYSVATRPSETSITCREILSYVAQLAGCFARCNTSGAVEIRWYVEPASLYDVGRDAGSYDVADSDTIITGVQIKGNDEASTVYKSGTDAYVLRFENNPLAQDGLQALTNTLATKFVGMTFRAYSVSSPSNPAVEAGDIVNMTDKSGVTHKTFVSRISYEFGESENYNADAETTAENQSERFTAADKAQESADKAQITADSAVQEVELAKVSIGNLTVRVTATETGLQSKVGADQVSTIIRQSPEDIVYAFNMKDGTTQTVKFTGDGFDFFNGDTNIGHMGINGNHLNFTLVQGASIQWNASSDYGMQWYPFDQTDGNEGGMHTGNLYPKYINMKGGKIMNCNTVETANLTVNGSSLSGMSGDIPVRKWDDSGTRHIVVVNGLIQNIYDS